MAVGWNVVWETGLCGFPEAVPFCFQETAISLPSPSLSVFLGPSVFPPEQFSKGQKTLPLPPIFSSLASYILVDAANGQWVSWGRFQCHRPLKSHA